MRISDWSSDVCSSDLQRCPGHERSGRARKKGHGLGDLPRVAGPALGICARKAGACLVRIDVETRGLDKTRGDTIDADSMRRPFDGCGPARVDDPGARGTAVDDEIGRASWRERVFQYV